MNHMSKNKKSLFLTKIISSSLKRRLIAIFCSLICVTLLTLGVIVYTLSINGMEEIQADMLETKLMGDIESMDYYLRNYYGYIKLLDGELLDLSGNSLEGRTEMVDAVLEDLGDESTIFVKRGDSYVVVTTSIENEDGHRDINGELDKNGEVYKTVLKGEAYYGISNIMGIDYYSVYEPVNYS